MWKALVAVEKRQVAARLWNQRPQLVVRGSTTFVPPRRLRCLSTTTNTTSSSSTPVVESATNVETTQTVTTNTLLSNLQQASLFNQGNHQDSSNGTKQNKRSNKNLWDIDQCRNVALEYDRALHQGHPEALTSQAALLAFRVLLRCHYSPEQLRRKVRSWEKALGKYKQTNLTSQLSLRLLEANGKAGNVGRVLHLLHLRRHDPPTHREFFWALTALQAARHGTDNYLRGTHEQPPLDNPTRWLDAILLHMAKRNFALQPRLARHMLECYAAGGKTGKLVHHFYRIQRKSVDALPPEERPEYTDEMPHEWDGQTYRPFQVRLRYNDKSEPPYYKVPAQAKGQIFQPAGDGGPERTKLQLETEPEYSPTLAAAFAFADSLQHGACGHKPIVLDVHCYNALIKACVQRGALWRAMQVLDVTMPSADCTPNNVSYLLLLNGLAAVGDVTTIQEYFHKLQAQGLTVDPFVVRAIVNGLLNVGDASAAVTVVQDFFNQHNVLPPYYVHTRILEVCLARDLVYEAKRHLYFLQQLWHWQPNEYHDTKFVKLMRATQNNTQLQKPALQKIFAYFGVRLQESDFI